MKNKTSYLQVEELGFKIGDVIIVNDEYLEWGVGRMWFEYPAYLKVLGSHLESGEKFIWAMQIASDGYELATIFIPVDLFRRMRDGE